MYESVIDSAMSSELVKPNLVRHDFFHFVEQRNTDKETDNITDQTQYVFKQSIFPSLPTCYLNFSLSLIAFPNQVL